MSNFRSLLYIIVCFLISCGEQNSFYVDGIAEGVLPTDSATYVYLERNGLDGVVAEDTCKVGKSGKFSLKLKKQSDIEYYHIRYGGKRFNFVVDEGFHGLTLKIDSVQNVSVVKGDEVNKGMAEAQSYLSVTNKSIRSEIDSFVKKGGNRDSLNERIFNICQEYKDSVRKIVFSDTKSPIAYYVVFQKLAYNVVPFRLDDKADLKCISAIATAWQVNRPNSVRTKHICNLISEARRSNHQEVIDRLFDGSTTNFVDIELPNHKGVNVKLSSLLGNFIMLDFCSYSQMEKQDFEFLKNLYAQNRSRGLEFYQISFDQDTTYWKDVAATLPWTCVHDAGLTSVVTYNVSSLPSNYLLDRKGNVIAKNISYDKVTDFIKKYK